MIRVVRNFEKIYKTETDPWKIGEADSERYNLYYQWINKNLDKKSNQSVLDIGCGLGAFLSHFKDKFNELVGVELSQTAVDKGKERFPFIDFIVSPAEKLATSTINHKSFDLIICSDVIYYLKHEDRIALIHWMNCHLTENGMVFVAAWCPGGRYLSKVEFNDLVRTGLLVKDEKFLTDSSHYFFIAFKKKNIVSFTIDYETWHPIPKGKVINWEKDILNSTQKMLSFFKNNDVSVSFFIEVGEYLWLKENSPDIADKLADQFRDIIRQGHDIQLHLHPCWLPEIGAKKIDNDFWWDWSLAKAHDYPYDLSELIKRCKSALEDEIRREFPSYEITFFRAGGYQAQPFERLSQALIDNNILFDSSIYAGGVSPDRGYDFSCCHNVTAPYWASLEDLQLYAPVSERKIIELPIFTYKNGSRVSFDGRGGGRFGKYILRNLKSQKVIRPEVRRFKMIVKRIFHVAYKLSPRIVKTYFWGQLSNNIRDSLLSFYDIKKDSHKSHNFYTLIGHTKADLNFEAMANQIQLLKCKDQFLFRSLSSVSKEIIESIDGPSQGLSKEAESQVEREYSAIIAKKNITLQSRKLVDFIPWDAEKILDFGCGTGSNAFYIAAKRSWSNVVGIDFGADFIRKANEQVKSDNISFYRMNFSQTSFEDNSFDCVFADNTLEHSADVQLTLSEIHRILKKDGALIAAIPADAYNHSRDCDNHIWKTNKDDVLSRLKKAGFQKIEMLEIDTLRLGMPSYSPSSDKMIYLRAWASRQEGVSRARYLMNYVYTKISPEKNSSSFLPEEIMNEGCSWCYGYSVVLAEALSREGFKVKIAHLMYKNHERGRGRNQIDSHTIVLLENESKTIIMDATTNYDYGMNTINEVLKNPEIVEKSYNKLEKDNRFMNRRYDYYVSPEALRKVYALKEEGYFRRFKKNYREVLLGAEFAQMK